MHPYHQALTTKAEELKRSTEMLIVLSNLANLASLSDTASFNVFGSESVWIYVQTREDLETAMSCVPGIWAKVPAGNRIRYTNTFGNFQLVIYAGDSALPPTCKVITETVQHPAREAYTETIERIVCDV